jgi:hypothetical protein
VPPPPSPVLAIPVRAMVNSANTAKETRAHWDSAVTVAAFVLALIGTVVSAVSLTWNIVAFLLQVIGTPWDARPGG